MSPEQKIAYLQSQMLCAFIEIQGMIAENQHRTYCGHSIAHGEDSFMVVIDKYKLNHNDVISFLMH